MKRNVLRTIRMCLTALGIAGLIQAGGAMADGLQAELAVGSFSSLQAGAASAPDWEPLIFKKIEQHTRYDLVTDEGVVVVRAVSEAAASGWIRKIQIDPMAFPILEWRWKVRNVLEKGDVTRKEGDDYPARIYITFAYDPSKLSFMDRVKYKAAKLMYGEYPPTGAINYIWGNHVAVDTIVPNPYTDRAMMIAVESGTGKIDQWVSQKRNLLEDYRKAFHTDPPPISGVAIMTDTDNTGESATAYYGDIVFRQLPKN